MQEMTIISIPRKGDPTKIENYRQIVRRKVTRKPFEKLILLTYLPGIGKRPDII